MPYGLDLDEVRYEVDASGHKHKAIIPLTMFSALTEFWIAARKAQTASIEHSAKPGQFKGSLQAHVPSGISDSTEAISSPSPASPRAHGRPAKPKPDDRWQQLLERLPDDIDSHHSPVTVLDSQTLASASARLPQIDSQNRKPPPRVPLTFYPREFVAPPPEPVAKLIREGTYFLKAWRMFRDLSEDEVAELLGRTPDTVRWHQHGYNKPTPKLLLTFADVFDCTLDQLTAKPGSQTQPWLTVIESGAAPAPKAERRAPEDTDYPDAVLAHLMAGKHPITAWRLYRGLTMRQLADRYGTKEANLKVMEEGRMKPKTIDRLCTIFNCKPAQLLRPEGLPVPDRDHASESPASRRIRAAMQAGQQACG